MNALIKTIKQISTSKYEIAIIELPDGRYCVFYGRPEDPLDKYTASEEFRDYNIASYMFDIKLQELEGN
jgi:hypothetical protein